MGYDRDDVRVDVSGLEKGEKIVVERDAHGRITSIKKDNDCWIVTANYGGDPFHPDVCTIRAMRDSLLTVSVIGPVISQINEVYKATGKSFFGQWWKSKLSQEDEANFHKKLTGIICRILLFLSR